MKRIKILLMISFCMIITLLTNAAVSNAYTPISNHITVENDLEMTKQKLHPVIILKNNTSTDYLVTYDFYIHKTDANEFSDDILVKANETVTLELPQLHHLGDTNESRTIWFSWMEKNTLKPLQTQIETSLFKNPVNPPEVELGLN